MKSSGVLAIIVASLGLAACAPSGKVLRSIDGQILNLADNSPFSIINGKDVEPTDEFTASVAGIFNLEDNSLCTGSLIADSYVLTAAHCMARDPKNLRVFFGRSMDEIVAINKVSGAVIPTLWGNRFEEANDWGDIAVIKIEGELPKGYKPIRMLETDSLQQGQDTLIAGYGITDGVKKEGSGILRKTSVLISNPKFGISEASLDQRQGTGACHGDSGGPAYLLLDGGYALWGVTSRGLEDPNDDCTQYAIYTNAVIYKDWITQARMELLGL